MKSLSTYTLGHAAEHFAAFVLTCKGYRILARRYKTPVGEVDIIARRGKVTAFVEVKARATLDGALESITPRGQGRVVRAALHYASVNPAVMNGDMRFDVFAFAAPFRWRHLDNAWRPDT
jgi:putative endonuclease